MRMTLFVALLSIGVSTACKTTFCEQRWSEERESLIRGSICSDEHQATIDKDIRSLEIPAVDGTMVVIDTDTGRIVRVPASVTGPENSRLAPVRLDAVGAEIIRPAAASPAALELADGVGFLHVTEQGVGQAVLVADSVKIGPTYVRVIGARPLTLVGSTVLIEGIVDVAAGCVDDPTSASCGGPGGGDGGLLEGEVLASGCAPGQPGLGGSGDDTGGGGGGFGAPGAGGGSSLDDREGGAGGDNASCADATLARFEGGSGGGYGEGGGEGGSGGGGGGAFRVLASCEIHVGDTDADEPRIAGIWAGGGGGVSAEDRAGSGGGGGGSGGAILLEAPIVNLSGAVLAANGGGGGSGGYSAGGAENGAPGTFGDEPAAGGGVAPHAGGAGGSARAPAQTGFNAVDGLDGTGGGGGAVGRIRINTEEGGLVELEAVMSPAASAGVLVRERD